MWNLILQENSGVFLMLACLHSLVGVIFDCSKDDVTSLFLYFIFPYSVGRTLRRVGDGSCL